MSGPHGNEEGGDSKILIPLSGSIDIADLKNISPDQVVKGEVVLKIDGISGQG